MRIHDSKTRRSLKRIVGVVLMVSCAAGIAASISIPVPVLAQNGSMEEAAPGSAQSVSASGIDRHADRDTPATARPGGVKDAEDAEVAALLGWHLNANNVYGISDPEDMPHSR
jgi:hypothetical protein